MGNECRQASTATEMEAIPIIAAVFHKNAFIITLQEDRPDFWVFLGGHVGWGRFQNTRRAFPEKPEDAGWIRKDKITGEFIPVPDAEAPPPLPPTKEVDFVVVEVCPAGDAQPHPVLVSSNVLWRKQEALEVYRGHFAYLAGLDRGEDTASAPLTEIEVEFVPSPETEEKFDTFKHDLKILGDAIDQLPELEAKRLKPLQSRFLELIVELAHNLLMVKGYGYVKTTGTRK